MATRFLSVTLRSAQAAADIPYELFSDRPVSSYKVMPLSRLEDEWLRTEGLSA